MADDINPVFLEQARAARPAERGEFPKVEIPGQLSGAEVAARVRTETDAILMSFSTGKDSIAAWLVIRDMFPSITPYYMYNVPGMAFIEESLQYYEVLFDTHILRIPHPSFYRQMKFHTFQSPENCAVIEAARLYEPNYDQVTDWIIEDQGLPENTWIATGVRAADSPNRRSAVKQRGAMNWNRRNFWPVWDMRKDELIHVIEHSGVKLPIDYEWFGRSFDGLDSRFIAPLRQHAPEDFARLLEYFPLADIDIARREFFGLGREEGYRVE